jgi:hypothetical protein
MTDLLLVNANVLKVRVELMIASNALHPLAAHPDDGLDLGQEDKGGESACRPGSVRPLARAGGHPSRTAVADSLMRSTPEHRAGSPQTLAQVRAVKHGPF